MATIRRLFGVFELPLNSYYNGKHFNQWEVDNRAVELKALVNYNLGYIVHIASLTLSRVYFETLIHLIKHMLAQTRLLRIN